MFAFPGNDATVPRRSTTWRSPSTAAGARHRDTRTIDIFHDGFAESGALRRAAAADYAIRVDMARDVRPNATAAGAAGDSLILDVVPRKPGASVDMTSIFLEFVLQTQNPDHFAPTRAAALTGLGLGGQHADRSRQVPGSRGR